MGKIILLFILMYACPPLGFILFIYFLFAPTK